ncbi:MAG: AtpZ/AtpI family protein [Crocinitomicaceae bacterium]|nr:AtpZ/AtpI family protein [Crocinitomicaceae bacterium]
MEKKSNSSISKFARFSSVGIQMGVIIALFTWLGDYIDTKVNNKTPWWTLFFSLFGVTAGLVLVIKEVIKMGKEDAEK